MKTISAILCCLVAVGCSSPSVSTSQPEAIGQSGGTVPILSQVGRVMLFTPNMAWSIDIRPDGSINAQFGSSGGDDMCLPKGTIDFKQLYTAISHNAQVQKDETHPIPVSMQALDAKCVVGVYMNPKQLPEVLLQLEAQDWQSMFVSPLPGPVPDRLMEIRKKHPIELITEQTPGGDCLKAAPQE